LAINWESVVAQGNDAKENAKRYDEEIAKLDELFDQTKRYGASIENDANTPTDVRLESLLPVVLGQRTVFVRADRQATIESAIAYFTSRDIPIVVCGGADAMHCVEALKTHDIPVILVATYRLPRRRHDSYDALYTLPAQLQTAGVRFAIAGEGSGYPGGASNVRNLAYQAGVAVAYGLSREHAVRAITGSAASILGVDDKVGTLTSDHHATFIIADGDILETETQVIDAYVQGRRVDLNSRHTQLFKKYQQKGARSQ
jgi:imidazolonepropionase-like amidohydrolase